ncbi:MAG: phosphatase PAP2 family protein [Corynebacterium sp.]|nr:phosphatase PAP2 family protein [Corynebacterium sp.]
MFEHRRALIICIALLSCASIVCAITPLDHSIFHTATRYRSFGQAVTLFTNLGRMDVLAPIALLCAAVVSLRQRTSQPIMLTGIAAICAPSTSHTLKNLVQRPRPDTIFAVSPYETSWSFPSGHSLNAVVVAGILALLVSTAWAYWSAALFAFLMGISRVYLGHHWPSDVFAGWALGVAWIALFTFLVTRRSAKPLSH